MFRGELGRIGNAGEAANYVLDALGDRFTRSDLDARLDNLRAHLSTREHGERAVALIRAIADRSYAVEFPSEVSVSERVLWPSMEAEHAGMEDARFVRFVDDDGSVTYYATYTAYSGSHISQQLLKTKDFQSFTSGPLVGKAAANKGLALFPDEYTVATPPCRDRTARPTASPSPTIWRSGRARRPASSRLRHGKRCNSEIAARQSKPTQGG